MSAAYRSVFIEAKIAKGQSRDFDPDGADLASQVEKACNKLSREGFMVISVMPVIGGNSGYQGNDTIAWSMTTGVVITAEEVREGQEGNNERSLSRDEHEKAFYERVASKASGGW